MSRNDPETYALISNILKKQSIDDMSLIEKMFLVDSFKIKLDKYDISSINSVCLEMLYTYG